MPQIFTQPNRGTFADQLNQARKFVTGAGGSGGAVQTAQVQAFAAGEPAVIDAAAQFVPDAATAPAGAVASDDLARAAQEAATGALVDPAFRGAADQVLDIQVQPRLIVQGQSGPIIVPVDIAIPAAQPRVTIATPTAVVVDPATGQAIAAQQFDAAPVAVQAAAAEAVPGVATAQRQGLRGMTATQLGELFGAGRARSGAAAQVVAPAAATETAVAATQVAPAPTRGASILDQLRGIGDQLVTPRTTTTATEGASAGAGSSLLARIRAGSGGLEALARKSSGDVANVATDVAGGVARSGLLNDLRNAAQLVSRVNPKG